MCLKNEELELFPQKLFMWRKMKVSASYCSLFLFLGIKTSSEALRQFVSWSELVNSHSFSGAAAVVISWGFLMLKKLPFITARRVSKAVSLCNVQFACSCIWQLLPSPAHCSFLTFWSILTKFGRGIGIFRMWSSDTFFAHGWLRRGGWVHYVPTKGEAGRNSAFILSLWWQMPG